MEAICQSQPVKGSRRWGLRERREGRGGNDILSKGGHETERKVKRTLRHINGLALAAPGGCGQAKGGAGRGRARQEGNNPLRRVKGGRHLKHSLQQLKFCLFSCLAYDGPATHATPTNSFS